VREGRALAEDAREALRALVAYRIAWHHPSAFVSICQHTQRLRERHPQAFVAYRMACEIERSSSHKAPYTSSSRPHTLVA